VTVNIEIAAATRARPDEAVGGDMAFVQYQGDTLCIVCMDVLGHGPKAYAVAKQSMARLKYIIGSQAAFDPIRILQDLDKRLAGGRGAAIAVCHINTFSGVMTFSGVGNINVRCVYNNECRLISKSGVVGSNIRTLLLQKVGRW
jgi:negative regulator of sigma-B (phosphoserine phosphatase)